MWLAFLPKLVHFAADSCNSSFFGFPVWWKYINPQPSPPLCEIEIHGLNDLWAIGFAVIDMLLYAAGFVAVISIIIAGFMYVTSAGNAEKATSARRRIINAFIGLAIVLIAIPAVHYFGEKIG